MQGRIQILGQIGTELDERGNIIERGVELVDVITQVAAIAKDESVKELTVEINSPGGYKIVGDEIYNYLISLKPKYKIKTMQVGLIGSIATKVFMAGDERILNDTDPFFIHNPWRVAGAVDAVSAQRLADNLKASKNDLLDFYIKGTGADKAALEPLMDNETALTSEQALTLGFATSIVKAQPKEQVFASIKTNMSKEKTEKNALQELIEGIKALIPSATKAMVELKTADGKVLASDAADEGGLKGSSVTIDSQPAPDGQYKLVDGRNVTVAGGKISDVAAAADPVAARFEAIEKNIGELAGLVKSMAEANKTTTAGLVTQAKLDESLKTIKALITGKHEPDKALDKGEGRKLSPIQKHLQEKAKV